MVYLRDVQRIFEIYEKFPVIAMLGPRQSGKTTLVRSYFSNYAYVSLENYEHREFALHDPQGFIEKHENPYGMVIDEFQHAPKLLSYIQLAVDEKKRPGYFVLTGSQNFLMNKAISQSLAGRVGIVTLLPLSIHELIENGAFVSQVDETMFHGFYPRVYAEKMEPYAFYASYVDTYIKRDVQELEQVKNLNAFKRFLEVCAARIGQLLNVSDVAAAVGVGLPTISSWLSILEASYIAFTVQPYYKNYNKRIVTTPKIFFYDTGLACHLLNIRSTEILNTHIYRGHLFENMIMADFMKQFFNRGIRPPVYFWRDRNGRVEVDCVIDAGVRTVPIEIKASRHVVPGNFKGLRAWNEIANTDPLYNYLVYTGEFAQKRSGGQAIPWSNIGEFAANL